MELLFLRHGEAGERRAWGGSDEERPLTAEGRAQTAAEGLALRRLQIVPDIILTSPLVRARQTAEILATEMGVPDRLIVEERLGYDFRWKKLRELLSEQPHCRRLMLIGHEPDFSESISKLIGGGQVVLKKGGLAIVSLDGPDAVQGELLCLVTPQMLELGATN